MYEKLKRIYILKLYIFKEEDKTEEEEEETET